jgi:5-methyltetrahydrofolate--homocysteine methyltransferase
MQGSNMTRTIVASATREVIIGFDQPFCVIGERINPTGRKKLAAEMIEGNFDTVIKDALEQVAAGATMLDVNAGVTSVNPNETEPGLLVQTMEIVQGLVDVPLSIDSSVTAAIEAALKVAKGRPLVNSVTGEMEKLEAILPLCKKYDVPVVAISNDETGISEDPDVRFAVAKKIVEHAADYGIKPHDIVVDPLVMPIGAMGTAGQQVFALLHRLRNELKVNTTCGLSNISFGLPHRHGINAGFIPMVIGAGMTSAIMNPCRPQEMEMVRAANVLNGNDANCMNWIKTYKDYQPHVAGSAPAPQSAAPSGEGGGRRRGGRAARPAEHNPHMTDHLVLFMPSGKRGRFPDRHAGARCRAAIGRACRERLRRARHLRPLPGRGAGRPSFAKHGITSSNDHISPFGGNEVRYAEKRDLKAGRRLSCSAKILGDLVIDIPQDAVVNAQVVRKDSDTRHRAQSGRPHVLCRGRRARHAQAARRSRPAGMAIEADWGFKGLAIDAYLYGRCSRSCARATGRSPPRSMNPSRAAASMIALYPGLQNEAYGIACDIGSTTIAMHLSSLLSGRTLASSGTSNPQIRFGEDLMSRVSYVMMNPDGREGMTKAVREGDQRADRQGLRGRRDRPRRYSRRSLRRQPDHASSVSGHRPDRAWRRALRAGRLRRGQRQGRTEIDIPLNPGAGSICCPASPAMSAPTRPQRHCPKARTARTR